MIHIQGHQAMVGFQIFSESGDFFFSDAGHAAHIHIIRQVMNLNGNGYGIGGASFNVFFIMFVFKMIYKSNKIKFLFLAYIHNVCKEAQNNL